MLTTIALFTIIGSRLFTIPINEWGRLIGSGSTPEFNNRSAVGGLLFGIAGLLFAQKFFGFGRPILDLYAWITPIGLGIQKAGCFVNGCCYGKPTSLPWGVQYGEGAHAHFDQWSAGIIDQNAILSNAVHPVQLYEMIFLFAIAFIVWKTHRIWKKEGSALLFSFMLFFFFRFALEMRFIPAVLLTGFYLYKAVTVQKYRLATSLLLVLPFFLMSQSFPSDSVKVLKYNRIDLGTSIGSLYSELAYNPHEGYCGTAYTRDDYKQVYRMVGAGFSQITEKHKQISTYGINVYAGPNNENNLSFNRENSFFLFGINPYMKYDWNWVGMDSVSPRLIRALPWKRA